MQVTVIGAGFSGLVSAWSLSRQGHKVSVVSRPGAGLIATLEHPLGLVETAANGLLASARVEELFADLGLEIQTSKKSARRRFLAVSGRVTRFPLTPLEAFKAAVLAFTARRKPPLAEETLHAWGTRVFGPAMTEKIIGPAMLGIYASDARNLSASLIVGRFYENPRRRNVRGRLRGTVSAFGGMGTLLKALRKKLESNGVTFQTVEQIQDLAPFMNSSNHVILATAAWEAAEILSAFHSGDSRIPILRRIRSIPILSLTLFFRTQPARRGFGTLFAQTPPFGERDGILGCLQNSEIFEGRAKPGVHAETWILGGTENGDELLRQSDDELLARVLDKRDRLIESRSREMLLDSVVTRWARAIPMYSPELEAGLSTLRSENRPALEPGHVTLFGNYLGELGLASILERTKGFKS